VTVWLVIGVIVLGLGVLVYAAVRLLGGLGRLQRAQRALAVRADQAKQLEAPIAELQRQAEAMQVQLEAIAVAAERRSAANES
jgi:cell division protein FtsB